MLERKLHFENEMDDLRLLLMREPRGHGAMSGAILQPPLLPDADWGVIYIEVSGCLPMCGHGTIGVATVLVETGMVEVTEPETVIRLDVPAGLVERAGRRRERPRALGDDPATSPSFLHARDRTVDVPGPRHDHLRHGVRRQLLRAHAGRRRRPVRRPGALRRADRGRARGDGGDQRHRPPRAPRRPAHRRLPPRRLPRAGPRRRRRRRRHLDPPGLAGPLPVRHRHQRPDGPTPRPRRARARRSRSSTSP